MSSERSEELIEEYRVDDFTLIRVVRRKNSLFGPYLYVVVSPELSDVERKVIDFVRSWFIDKYPSPVLDMEKLSVIIDGVVDKFAPKLLKKWDKNKEVSKESIERIKYVARRDIVGFGKLEPMLKDPNIEDIHVLGIGKPIYVWHRFYENLPTNIYFLSPEDLNRHLQKLMLTSGKFVSLSRPIVDGKLPMGYRINVVHSVISELGTAITIRKHREVPFNIVDLIKLGTIAPELAALLWVALENKRSVFIVGETAAGKTTLLNAIATLIPLTMKLSVIEEVREINLPHPNVVYMVSREGVDTLGSVSLYDLVKTSLRQRPDYIVVGEIRGKEAYVLLQAISLGHGGLCLPYDQEIPANIDGEFGLYKIGEIVAGAVEGKYRKVNVLTLEGSITREVPVRSFIIKQGTKRFIRIFTSDGSVHEVHEDHPVITYYNGRILTKLGKGVKPGDYLIQVPLPETLLNRSSNASVRDLSNRSKERAPKKLMVSKVEVVEKDSLLYDIEVPGTHTFAVSEGAILTHNSTMHAEGAEAAVRRLMAPPMNIPPYLIKLLDMIIHITKFRLKEGVKRYVMTASEIRDIDPETKEPKLNVIYKSRINELGLNKIEFFRPEESITLEKITEVRGIDVDMLLKKVWKRADFLKELSTKDVNYNQVIIEISRYTD